uniref:phosphatidate phosphatase n=2 Tax=Mesocestoides corti TaxID=53468 RepID=A0A5K3EGT2_MESCO
PGYCFYKRRSLGRLFSGIKGVYNELNPATLTGAVDVIVVEDNDGNFCSGPFHVRFGKMGAINPADKIVEIYVNGEQVEFLHMRLGSAGSAYFVEDVNSPLIDSDSESNTSGTSYAFLDSSEPIMRVRSVEDISKKPVMQYRNRRRRRKYTKDVIVNKGQPNFTETPRTYDFPCNSPASMSDSEIEKQYTERIPIESCNVNSWKPVGFLEELRSSTDQSPSIFTRARQASVQEGVYLEDLVTSSVDENFKQAYLYVASQDERKKSQYRSQESNAVDAGYRSDPEHSIYRPMETTNQIFELKLSLCGGLSADSQINYDQFCAHLVTFEEFSKDPAVVVADPNLVLLLNGKFYNWNTAAPMILSYACFRTELPYSSIIRLAETFMPKKRPRRRAWFTWATSEPDPLPASNSEVKDVLSESPILESSGTQNVTPTSVAAGLQRTDETQCPRRRITLTSEEIDGLGLKPGANDIEYRIVTKYQGTASCTAKIYLWRSDDKLVVSDVDGTITRSDILGHVLPMLGRDWTHDGVAELYSKVAENGYKFVYLSARAIGQAGVTRNYIEQVLQRDKFRLPDGPILLSPTSLFDAFHREVIAGTPEVFKIECLKQLKNLFGPDSNPFFSAFGNRANDVKAYMESGFELGRIFTVNSNGELRNEYLPVISNSFDDMVRLVDHLFPCIPPKASDYDLSESDDEVMLQVKSGNVPVDVSVFSSFTFWRDPVPTGMTMPT